MKHREFHFAIVCLLAAICCLADSIGQDEMIDLYSQAREFFRQANRSAKDNPQEAMELYRKAAVRFERIAWEGGIRNGKLYYNLGNVYFRMQEIGRAILYYRRAQMFIADDPNLQQNLAYARSKRIDRIEEKQKTRILSTVFFWHYDFSPKTRLVLLVVFSTLFWTCATVRLFLSRTWIAWGMAITGTVFAAFLSSLALDFFMDPWADAGVILSQEVVARKGDGESYDPSFKEPLHAGTEFVVLERRREWRRIELADGRQCWVPSAATGPVKPEY